jgi:hypothetical protein
MKDDKEEDDLPALFRDDLPEKLSDDLLALAHLSDVEEEPQQTSGPVRRSRTRTMRNPYDKPKQKKTEAELLDDELKELDFRTRAWKPYRKNADKKQS